MTNYFEDIIGYDTKCECKAKIPHVKRYPSKDGSNRWVCQVCGGIVKFE